MTAESQGRDRRRGERVLIRVPVQLNAVRQGGGKLEEAAETVVVSRYGALLRAYTPLKKGSTLRLKHGFSQEAEEFRVVWVSEGQQDGCWEVGAESLRPLDDFWGVRFPPARLRG